MKLFFLHLSPYQMAEENMAHKSEGNFLVFLKWMAFQTKKSQPILLFLIITLEFLNNNNSIWIAHFILRIIIQNIFLDVEVLFLHTALVKVLPEP